MEKKQKKVWQPPTKPQAFEQLNRINSKAILGVEGGNNGTNPNIGFDS